MAFKHLISFATFWAANFGCYLVAVDSESRLIWLSRFCAPLSEVAVLLDSNLSRHPILRQVVELDLLLCIGFNSERVVLFLCHIFTQRQMTDSKIERSDGHCFGRQKLVAYSIENFTSYEKKKSDSSLPEIYKALKSCLLLNWVSIARVVACFLQASLLACRCPQRLPQTRKRPVFVLARPTRASRARERTKELGRWFCALNLRLPSGAAFGEIARWPAVAQTWAQTWSLPPGQRVVKVLPPLKSQHKMCGVLNSFYFILWSLDSF